MHTPANKGVVLTAACTLDITTRNETGSIPVSPEGPLVPFASQLSPHLLT